MMENNVVCFENILNYVPETRKVNLWGLHLIPYKLEKVFKVQNMRFQRQYRHHRTACVKFPRVKEVMVRIVLEAFGETAAFCIQFFEHKSIMKHEANLITPFGVSQHKIAQIYHLSINTTVPTIPSQMTVNHHLS